jgi:hypothetical protein
MGWQCMLTKYEAIMCVAIEENIVDCLIPCRNHRHRSDTYIGKDKPLTEMKIYSHIIN